MTDYITYHEDSDGFIHKTVWAKHDDTTTKNKLINVPAGTTVTDETFKPLDTTDDKYNCLLMSPESKDPDINHNWKAKVRANFIFEECEDCHKIRNKKKLV